VIVQSARNAQFKTAPVSDEIPDGISSAIFFPGISFIFRIASAKMPSTFLESPTPKMASTITSYALFSGMASNTEHP